jgi:hypothetical protein
MIDRVAELKKLQIAEASATYKQAGDEFGYECQVLNAAPALLDILGEIRPGDAQRFALLILNNQQRYTDYQWQKAINMLRRYQTIAARMEAESDER